MIMTQTKNYFMLYDNDNCNGKFDEETFAGLYEIPNELNLSAYDIEELCKWWLEQYFEDEDYMTNHDRYEYLNTKLIHLGLKNVSIWQLGTFGC